MSGDKKYKIGFTGTRHGMTPQQKACVRTILADPRVKELHHGSCVGADAEAHTIARETGLWIVVHPPTDTRLKVQCEGANEVRDPFPYLVRNRHIVICADVVVATPHESGEHLRSGTWMTVRYARALGRRTLVIDPDGRLHE